MKRAGAICTGPVSRQAGG